MACAATGNFSGLMGGWDVLEQGMLCSTGGQCPAKVLMLLQTRGAPNSSPCFWDPAP